MDKKEIKAGDVVRLKSGSPLLTVHDVYENCLCVTWYDEASGEFRRDEGIPAAGYEKAPK